MGMKKWVEVKQYLKVIRRGYWDDPKIQQLIDDLEPLLVDLAKEIDYLKKERDGRGDC